MEIAKVVEELGPGLTRQLAAHWLPNSLAQPRRNNESPQTSFAPRCGRHTIPKVYGNISYT